MQLSIEEVKKLDSNSYQIIDIRSEEEVMLLRFIWQ